MLKIKGKCVVSPSCTSVYITTSVVNPIRRNNKNSRAYPAALRFMRQNEIGTIIETIEAI